MVSVMEYKAERVHAKANNNKNDALGGIYHDLHVHICGISPSELKGVLGGRVSISPALALTDTAGHASGGAGLLGGAGR